MAFASLRTFYILFIVIFSLKFFYIASISHSLFYRRLNRRLHRIHLTQVSVIKSYIIVIVNVRYVLSKKCKYYHVTNKQQKYSDHTVTMKTMEISKS